LFLEIRADQRVNFGHIEPILVAAAEAGISGMNITARPGWDRGGDGAGGESRP
jgi:biopolymer transport protein ExbD